MPPEAPAPAAAPAPKPAAPPAVPPKPGETPKPEAAPSPPPWEKLGLSYRKEGDAEVFEREVDDGRGGKRKIAIDAAKVDDFFRDHEFGKAGRQAMSEAEKERQERKRIAAQHEQDIADLRTALADPKTRVPTLLALAKAAGVKGEDALAEIVAEHDRLKAMTPEQRRIADLEARQEAAERAETEKKKAEEDAAAEGKRKAAVEAEVKLAESLWAQTGKALEQAKLPDLRMFRLHVTQWAAAEDHKGVKQLDFGQAARLARQDYVQALPAVLQHTPDAELLALIGDDAAARLVKLYGDRARGVVPSADGTRDRTSTVTPDRPDGPALSSGRRPSKAFVP